MNPQGSMAMPCHAMPCHAMSSHAMPCHAMSCHVMPCQRRHTEKMCQVCADSICPVTRDWADTVVYRITRRRYNAKGNETVTDQSSVTMRNGMEWSFNSSQHY